MKWSGNFLRACMRRIVGSAEVSAPYLFHPSVRSCDGFDGCKGGKTFFPPPLSREAFGPVLYSWTSKDDKITAGSQNVICRPVFLWFSMGETVFKTWKKESTRKWEKNRPEMFRNFKWGATCTLTFEGGGALAWIKKRKELKRPPPSYERQKWTYTFTSLPPLPS